jgi:hypothetical protein
MEDVKNQASGLSKASLICGICAIIPFVGTASGLAAIIMGIIDLVKISKGEAGAPGKKFDITGIILGVILPAVMWIILWVTIFAVAWGALGSTLGSY